MYVCEQPSIEADKGKLALFEASCELGPEEVELGRYCLTVTEIDSVLMQFEETSCGVVVVERLPTILVRRRLRTHLG